MLRMAVLTKLKSVVNGLYSRHLLATNIITNGTLLGLGDIIIQEIGRIRSNGEHQWDKNRTGCMVTMGFILGPFNHYWYYFLDHFVKRRGLGGVTQKILCDQAVAGPFFCSVFLVGTTLLEEGSIEKAKHEWAHKFLPVYMVDWCFWPAAQFFNFSYVPFRFRILYIAMATLVWNSFLSFMKHDMEKTDDDSGDPHIKDRKH